MSDVDVARVSAVSISRPAYIEWGPVLAGAFLAAAVSFVLLTFLTAIGFTAVSPWPNEGMSPRVMASLAAFFVLLQQIASFMAGGYVAGRMRTRWGEGDRDEVHFRDGLHGGLVWAIGVVIGAALIFSTASVTARTGAAAIGAGVGAAATSDPMDVVLDTLLRPARASAAEAAGAPAAPEGEAAAPASSATVTADTARAEMGRIIAKAVTSGGLSEQDRPYLASLVAQRTGLPQAEAEKRVDEAVTSAREAADSARKGAALLGFLTAASLMLSLGAAWWAARRGGHHRDNEVPARFVMSAYRRPVTPT